MNRSTLVWVGLVLVALMVGAFFGWYWYIRGKQVAVETETFSRGLGATVPSFSNEGGSLRGNIEASFGEPASNSPATSTPANTQADAPPRLWRVSRLPAAGAFLTPNGRSVDAYFIDSATGNVFRATPGREPVRVTNTLIPHIQEAFWINSSSVLLKQLASDGIQTLYFAAKIVQPTTTPTASSTLSVLDGVYLPKETVAVATNPEGKSPHLLYLVRDVGKTVGVLSDVSLKNPVRVWSSALSGWNIAWMAQNRAVLSQKAAEGVVGSSYVVSLPSGDVSPLVGNKEGLLIAASPSGEKVIYSSAFSGSLKTFLRVASTTRELPIKTLAEKCIWRNERIAYCAVPTAVPESFLDAWYQGAVHTTDSWFVLDTNDGSVSPYVSPEGDFGVSIDVRAPRLDASARFIHFTDAVTNTNWVLTL